MKRLLALLLAAALATGLASGASANHPALNASEVAVRDLLLNHASQNNPWTAHSLSIDAVDRANEIRLEYQNTGTISHAGAFDETTGCWDELGEIIAWTNGWDDYELSAAWVVSAWHNSPGHEAVMHGDYDYFGVGVTMIAGTQKRFYAVVWGKLGPPCDFGD